MSASWVKGVAGLLLVGILGMAAWWTWGRVADSPGAAASPEDFAVAWSSTVADRTNHWVRYEPARPGADSADAVTLMYRVEGPSRGRNRLGFAFSETAGHVVSTCEDQAWEVDHGVAFEDLPQGAREAAVRAVGTGRSDSTTPDAVTVTRADATEVAAGRTYTVVQAAVPTPRSSAQAPEGVVRCTADLSSFWSAGSSGDRFTTIPLVSAAPSTRSNDMYSANLLQVPTDDSFYFVRGSMEPEMDGVGMSSWRRDDGHRVTHNGFDLRTQGGVVVLFSGYDVEIDEKAWPLLTGLLLGVMATVVVELLKGGLDGLVRRD